MTRITFGAYRAGVRNTGLTLATYGTTFVPPTPFPSASAAVVRFHRDGPEAATRELDRSLRSSSYWGAPGSPQEGWANAIRESFEVYRAMASEDDRPAFVTGLNADLSFPPDELGVHVDVVLLDSAGYVPRLVLWDASDLSGDRAILYAAPAWMAAEQELGPERVPSVEVWHLRSRTQFDVSSAEAEAAMVDARRVVHRMTGSGP